MISLEKILVFLVQKQLYVQFIKKKIKITTSTECSLEFIIGLCEDLSYVVGTRKGRG